MDEPSTSYVPAHLIVKSTLLYTPSELRESYKDMQMKYYLNMISELTPEFLNMMLDKNLSGASIVEQVVVGEMDKAEREFLAHMISNTGINQLPDYRKLQKRYRKEMKDALSEIANYNKKTTDLNRKSSEKLTTLFNMQRQVEDEATAIVQQIDELLQQANEATAEVTRQYETLNVAAQKKSGRMMLVKKGNIRADIDWLERTRNLAVVGLTLVQDYQFPCNPFSLHFARSPVRCKFPKKFEDVSARLIEFSDGMIRCRSKFTEKAILVANQLAENVEKFCEIHVEHHEKLHEVVRFARNVECDKKTEFERKTDFLRELKTKEAWFTETLYKFGSITRRVARISMRVAIRPWNN